MVTLLAMAYGAIILMVAVWAISMLRSNRHFRTVIQHPSLTHHITS